MAEYTLAHIGINTENAEEAMKAAKLFELLFGFTTTDGHSSIFAGSAVELMKSPYLGKYGHIAIGTPDVAAAKTELEAKGFKFNNDSAKYKGDLLNAIYLEDEIAGFAVHLVTKK